MNNFLIKQEKQFIWLIILILIIITLVPYLYGYLRTPPGQEYLGLHGLTIGDIPTYYAKIEQIKSGNFLFSNLYAGADAGARIFNPFWLLTGAVARLTHLPNVMTFHLMRLLLIPVFIFVLYKFVTLFFNEVKKRQLTLLFIIFSSGLGTFFVNYFSSQSEQGLLNWPMDFWVPEAFTFLTLYHVPHFIASLTLIVSIFVLMFLALKDDRVKHSLCAGLCSLVLIFFHPFHVLTVFLVLAVYIICLLIKQGKIKWSYIKHYLILLFLSLPAIIYQIWLLSHDQLTRIIALQNNNLTPNFSVTLISYGFLIPLSIIGLYFLIKSRKIKEEKYLFLVVWLIIHFLLIYAPINWQRRLTEGLHIPLAIMSMIGFMALYNFLNQRLNKKWRILLVSNKFLLVVLFILFFGLSNFYVIARDFYLFNEHYSNFYLSSDKMRAMQWLKNHTSEEAVILSHAYHGNLIPGWSGRRVYVGHGVETPFMTGRVQQIKWFFSGQNQDEEKKEFLQQNKITYIYYGDLEQAMGTFQPSEKDYLKKVYEQGSVEVYAVKLSF